MRWKRNSILSKRDAEDMISWRYEYIKTLKETDLAYNTLLNTLDVRDKGYGGKLIKIGITIFFIPILGISELIGAILIGLGLLIKSFSRRGYPISRIGRDLSYSINYIKSFRDTVRLLE